MRQLNSRADLELLRGTPAFEDAMRDIHGSLTGWTLVDGAWEETADLTVLARFDFTESAFLAEIAPFAFPAPVPPALPPAPPHPNAIDLPRREFRRALLQNGMDTATVLAVINAIPDAAEREEMMIWWEDTQFFQRHYPVLVQMVSTAGLTEAQADAIWSYGVDLLNGG